MQAVNPKLRPLVLLDIDGVINMSRRTKDIRNRALYWVADGMEWSICVALDTEDALTELFWSAHEVMWCTAWRHGANEGPLNYLHAGGLVQTGSRLAVITNGGGLGTDGFVTRWKVAAVRRNETVRKALQEGRAVYWIEDFNWSTYDSPIHITQHEIAELGIRPIDTGMEGRLTLEHLERFLEFCDSTEAAA